MKAKFILPIFLVVVMLFLSSCSGELKHLTYNDITNCNTGVYNASDLGIDDFWFDLFGEYPKKIRLVEDDGVCSWIVNNKMMYYCKYGDRMSDFSKTVVERRNSTKPLNEFDSFDRNFVLSIYISDNCKMDDWFDLKVSAHELDKALDDARW